MPDWKVTWFFEGNQIVSSGSSPFVAWTETWYENTSASIDAAIRTALDERNGYLPRRMVFMPSIYRCTHVRVSEASNPRYSKFAVVRNQTGRINHTEANRAAAQVTCALLVNFTVLPQAEGDTTHHRRFLIRGLPNIIINGNELRRNSAVYRDLQAFLRWIGHEETPADPAPPPGVPNLAAAWSSFYKLRYAGSTSVQSPITALAVQASQREIAVTAVVGGAFGNKVSLTGVTFPRGVNRVWTVKSVPGADQMILGRSRSRLAGTWDGNGLAKKIAYALTAPQQFSVTGLRTRQTGKTVFQGPVGRRSRG